MTSFGGRKISLQHWRQEIPLPCTRPSALLPFATARDCQQFSDEPLQFRFLSVGLFTKESSLGGVSQCAQRWCIIDSARFLQQNGSSAAFLRLLLHKKQKQKYTHLVAGEKPTGCLKFQLFAVRRKKVVFLESAHLAHNVLRLSISGERLKRAARGAYTHYNNYRERSSRSPLFFFLSLSSFAY